MSRLSLRCATQVALAFAICTTVPMAHGQVYKCTNSAGKTTYADAPCSDGKPLKLPGDTRGSATDPHVCAQLLDETHRLAAEADRNARHGRTESTQSAKRRQSLTRQYEARCVGIRRSAPKSK
jgi:hypothetical protein